VAEQKDQVEQRAVEANRTALENLAKSQDAKSRARETRKTANRATRVAKGYETGV
jgi:hypothetical protein